MARAGLGLSIGTMVFVQFFVGCDGDIDQNRAETINRCVVSLGGEQLFVGNVDCLSTLPRERLHGFWVTGHEYSAFYEDRKSVKLEPDVSATRLELTDAAYDAVRSKLRGGAVQMFEVTFTGAKSTRPGIYGMAADFRAGALMDRVVEIREISIP